MRQSTRLVLNTGATYGRMLATVGMGLYAARLQLQALGSVDNGVFEAMGIAALVLFITDALTASAERHLGYAIGRNDQDELSKVFNTSLVLFAVVAAFVMAVSLALAPLIERLLVIPPDRVSAARWSFVLVSMALAASILTTPFRAMFLAHQEMFINTLFDLGRGLHTLLSAMLLFASHSDRLILFSVLTMAGNLLLMLGISLACMRRYPESRPRPSEFSRAWLGHISQFMFWATVGAGGWNLLLQGSVYLLNRYYGPVFNTTFGLARRIANYQGSLTQAISRAADPAITTIEARGDRTNVRRLVLMVSKYQAMMSLFYMVPVFLNLPFLLRLWLHDVPPETLEMSRFVMLWAWSGTWTQGHASAVLATGEIAGYAIVATIINLLSLLIPWICFHFVPGAPAYWLPMFMFIVRAGTSPFFALYLGRKINLGLWEWVVEIVFRVGTVVAVVFLPCQFASHLMQEGWSRLALVTPLAWALLLPSIWILGLGRSERAHFSRILVAIRSRVLGSPRVHIEPQQPGENRL